MPVVVARFRLETPCKNSVVGEVLLPMPQLVAAVKQRIVTAVHASGPSGPGESEWRKPVLPAAAV